MNLSKIFIISLTAISLFIFTASLAGSVLPTGTSEYEYIYDRIERAEALSFERYNYQLAPYFDSDFNYQPFSFLKKADDKKISLFSFIKEDYQAKQESHPLNFESIRGGFTTAPFKNSFIYANFILDEAKAKDENYTGKKWRSFAGGVDEAFFCFNSTKINLIVGRFSSFWGVRKSLVLSSANRLDGFGYSLKQGRLVLSYRLAKLNQTVTDLSYFNRYFAGHRLDIHLSSGLRIGLFESIIFGGSGRTIELNYLNPLIFFHSDQLNDKTNDNTFLGFDFTFKPKTGIKLYGQLLVDDFQIEKSNEGDNEPDQYAIHGGGYFVDLFGQLDIRAEYTRVTNWTFNQQYEHNRYINSNNPLADVLGNDYDQIKLSLSRWNNDNLKFSLNYVYLQLGEGSILTQWTAPWLVSPDNYSEPFPTGIIEKTSTFSLASEGFFMNHLYFNIEGGFEKINNYQHLENNSKNAGFIKIQLSSFFSTDINIE